MQSMLIYDLLKQIEKNISSNLYYTALFTALTIPDIGGAVDSENGIATGKKYIAWFDNYVAPRFYGFNKQFITGKDCYLYRCAMLHQGRSYASNGRYSKTIFLVTKQRNITYCGGAFTVENGKTLCIDVAHFCKIIIKSTYGWLEKVEQTDRFKKNSAMFLELFNLVIQ